MLDVSLHINDSYRIKAVSVPGKDGRIAHTKWIELSNQNRPYNYDNRQQVTLWFNDLLSMYNMVEALQELINKTMQATPDKETDNV